MSIDWTKVITKEDKFLLSKESRRGLIKTSFDSYIKGSFTCSLGYPMQFNEMDSLKMEGAIKLLIASGQPSGYLTDANDVTHYEVSIVDMQTVQLEMLMKFAEAHAQKQLLRSEIEEASNQEQLDSITWTLGE